MRVARLASWYAKRFRLPGAVTLYNTTFLVGLKRDPGRAAVGKRFLVPWRFPYRSRFGWRGRGCAAAGAAGQRTQDPVWSFHAGNWRKSAVFILNIGIRKLTPISCQKIRVGKTIKLEKSGFWFTQRPDLNDSYFNRRSVLCVYIPLPRALREMHGNACSLYCRLRGFVRC